MNTFNPAVSGRDWYSMLSLTAAASETEIAAAVELLGRRAAALAVTAPDRSRELREMTRSIKQDLLSGPEARQRYDSGLAQSAAATTAGIASPPQQPNSGQVRTPARGSGIARFLRTGWVCAACGTAGMPSDRFCMKCGAKIVAPGRDGPRTDAQPTGGALPCASCGGIVAPEHSFCPRCGAKRP